jgi:Protein kinase domain
MTSKRIVGMGLVASAGLAGMLAARTELARRALEANHEVAVATAQQARTQIQVEQDALTARARIAAVTRPLLSALEDHLDSNSLASLLQSEDWWRATRHEFSLTRVVVGSELWASTGRPDPGTLDRVVVSRARKDQVAATIEMIDREPFFLIGALLPVLADNKPVLVVAKAVDHALWAASSPPPPLPERGSQDLALMGIAVLLTLGGAAALVGKKPGLAATALSAATPGVPGATTPDGTVPWGVNGANRGHATAAPGTVGATPGAPNFPPPSSVSATPAPVGPPRHPSLPGGILVASDGNPGKTFGRYQLLDRLGEGGMAEVFTAVAHGVEGFSRVFVLKRLRPELARDKEAIGQFIDEARMQASLVHSNIVPVFDFGRVGDEYFMTQEYIVGRDLVRLIARNYDHSQQTLDPKIAYFIAHETLVALEYAHSKRDRQGEALGIVHRDVSAGNILVSAQGEVKLSDFGIVKSNRRVTKTQVGMVKGNANFMSPEQARGQNVDARSDLFSIALVLYYCLTNRLLYDGDNDLEVLYKAANGPTPEDWQSIRRLAPPARDLLFKALAVNPAERYQSAAEFAAALAPFVAGAKTEACRLMQTLFGEELGEEAA